MRPVSLKSRAVLPSKTPRPRQPFFPPPERVPARAPRGNREAGSRRCQFHRRGAYMRPVSFGEKGRAAILFSVGARPRIYASRASFQVMRILSVP